MRIISGTSEYNIILTGDYPIASIYDMLRSSHARSNIGSSESLGSMIVSFHLDRVYNIYIAAAEN